MLVTGIDENGLGPRLGPMTTSSVTLRLGAAYDRARLAARGLRVGLTDSKQTSASKQMAFAESVALALVEASRGAAPTCASAFLDALHLEGPADLRAPCPTSRASGLCHGHDLELPAFGGDLERGREALSPLVRGRGKIAIVDTRTVVSCAFVLNESLARGTNKLAVDLAAMERLAEHASRTHGEHAIVAGMVGGIRDVPRFASHIARERFAPLEETRARRAYRVDGVGELAFEVDADARHLPVALASILGKYLRELGMARIVGYVRTRAPDAPTPSGYHDPVTARFVLATSDARDVLGVHARCFEREG